MGGPQRAVEAKEVGEASVCGLVGTFQDLSLYQGVTHFKDCSEGKAAKGSE